MDLAAFFAPLAALEPWMLWAAAGVIALGGLVKGAVGFALPMVAVAGLGSFLDAQTAVAAMILPTVITNVWQAFRQGAGAALGTARRFWRLILILAVVIALVAQVVPRISSDGLFVALGVVVVTAAAVQLAGWRPKAPRTRRGTRALEATTGVVGGVTGGLAGIWGPPVLFYLVALGVEKVQMIRAQGLSYLTGSAVLVTAHLQSGLLDAETLPLSAALMLPCLIGMGVGLRLQDAMDPALFRKATLAVLCLAGLNLLRRGLF